MHRSVLVSSFVMNKKARTLLFILLLFVYITQPIATPAIGWSQTVAVKANSVKDVTAYGVRGDGVADDTAALQAAIDATPQGGIVQIPATANIKLTGTILVYGKNGITIEGSPGDSYGKTSPRLTWAGPPGGTMIRWVNNNSTQISGILFYLGSAAIAVDVDQDNDRTDKGTIKAGSNILTCPSCRFKPDSEGHKATDAGRTVTIAGAGASGRALSTTIKSVMNSTQVELAASAATSATSADIAIASPQSNNVSSSNRFERLMFNKVAADAATVGLRISHWSKINNERMQIDRCSCAFGGGTTPSTTRGTCFKIGDATTGGGGNAFNIIFTNPYWYGPSIGIDSQSATLTVINSESNFTTLDFNIVSGSARIIEARSEFQRQFLKATSARITIDGGFLGNGAWSSSYPLIYAQGSTFLHVTDLGWSEQSGITIFDADPNGNVHLDTNANMGNTSLTANFANFSQGVACSLCADRVGLFLGGATGVGSSIQMKGTTFGNLNVMFNNNLSAQGNGTIVFCQDCLLGSNPCKAGGTGAFAKRINGAWNCQ
jgi:hypothetical protein